MADIAHDPTLPFRIGLNRFEAAHHIGISAPTFDKLVLQGIMPKPKRLLTRLVWDRREIDAAFAQIDRSEPAAIDHDEYAV